LRGELDWITMKAMEKEPSRRYASAAELAADMRRYLNDEPVLAGPPSTVYRMKKFVHKHRVPVGAAAIVLLALIGGVVGTTWQAIAANRAKTRATQRFNDVRAIANKLLLDFDNSIMYVPGTLSARRLLVTTALEYLDKISRDAADDVNLENDLANAYIGVGKIQWEHSLPNIGDRPGAIASFKKAVDLARRAVSHQPDDVRLRVTLGLALARYGSAAYFAEPQPAIEAMTEALSIFQSLAQAVGGNRVVEIDVGAAMYSLGWALTDTGKVEEGYSMRQQALDHFKKLREKRPDDFDVKQWQAASHVMVGKSLHLLGKLEEAEREIRTGREIYVDLTRIIPNSVVSRQSIAVSDTMLGDLRAEQGDFPGAAQLYAQAVDDVGALMTADPSDAQARMDYGMNLYRLAQLQAQSGDNDAAIKTFETRFLPMVQKRYKPGHPSLATYQREYAELLRRAGRVEEAQKLLDSLPPATTQPVH
jgi:tetratricopeptide (TPR) repeat protein